jgi:hypothetical protein
MRGWESSEESGSTASLARESEGADGLEEGLGWEEEGGEAGMVRTWKGPTAKVTC